MKGTIEEISRNVVRASLVALAFSLSAAAAEEMYLVRDGKPGLILYSGPGLATSRAQGTLRGSYDEGKTWPWKLQYYQGPSGYSDIAVLPDGRVAILFEKDGKSKLGFTILPAPPARPPAEAGKE